MQSSVSFSTAALLASLGRGRAGSGGCRRSPDIAAPRTMSWLHTQAPQGAPGGPAALVQHHLLQGPENLSSSDIVQVSSAAFLVPCCLSTWTCPQPTHTHTHTRTYAPHKRTQSLTGLLGLGFAGALAGLAPHRQSVLQQLQVPALLPAGRSDLHHAAALHHQPNVVAVQTCGKKKKRHMWLQMTPLCSFRNQNNRQMGWQNKSCIHRVVFIYSFPLVGFTTTGATEMQICSLRSDDLLMQLNLTKLS